MARHKSLSPTEIRQLDKLLAERERLIGVLDGLSLKRLSVHFRCSRMTILRRARERLGLVRNLNSKVTRSTSIETRAD